MSPEKRKFPRKRVDLAVTVELEGTTTRVAGNARDLSIGGMFVETELRAPFGTKLHVYTRFAGTSGEVMLSAVVRWTAPDGIGLQFGMLGARETHAIVQLVGKY